MSEFRRQEDQPEIEQIPELENQPQAEMPEDFEDPEGKKSKWKEVVGEVEIEGKKVEVKYREKVIELPKHRQEETGIQRIRRRELLPPFPEGLRDTSGAYRDPFYRNNPSWWEKPQAPVVWSAEKKI